MSLLNGKRHHFLRKLFFIALSFLAIADTTVSEHDVCPEEKALHLLRMGIKPTIKTDFFKLGCEQMIIYQLAHLTMPEAKHFFEAGAVSVFLKKFKYVLKCTVI